MKRPWGRIALFGVLATAGCAADLLTKKYMFDWLGMPGQRPIWWVWPGLFGFQTSLNEGAVFGLAQGWVHLFGLLGLIAVGAVVYWMFWGGGTKDWLLTIALGLAMAGILGNLYDRLGLPGLRWHDLGPPERVGQRVYAVRDWILVMIGPFHWPNFNLADSFLVCAAAVFLLYLGRQAKTVSPASEPTDSFEKEGLA
jgi:signal peptidase II